MRPWRVSGGAASFLVLGCAWMAFVWLWPPSVLTLTVDDSFYYLEIATRVAHGEGITFDGLHTTSGFQPLWMWVLVAVARVAAGSIDTLVRVTLTLQVLLVWGGTTLLARAPPAGRTSNGFVVATVAMTCFYVFKIVVNGMESALQYALICATLAWWMRMERRATTSRISDGFVLGALCGLALLARLSAGAFGVALLSLGVGSIRTRHACLVAFTVFVAIALAYLVWNLHMFGHALPVSAAIKWAPSRSAVPYTLALLVAGAGCAALLVVAETRLRVMAPLVGYVVLQTVYDLLSRGTLVAREIWYFVPHLVTALIGGTAFLAATRGRWRRLLLVPAMGLLGVTIFTWQRRFEPASYATYEAAQRTAEWLSRETPRDAVVAGWDCGIIGAFAQRRVINLDGLANSWEFKERYIERNDVAAYLDSQRVDYLAQWFSLGEPLSTAIERRLGPSAADWRVVYVDRYEFRRFGASDPTPFAYVVLSRDGSGTAIRDLQTDTKMDAPRR